MIILDTNVVSEPLRQLPNFHVIEWIDSQPVEALYLTAITVAELRAGIALMPSGKRRNLLQKNIEQQVLPIFNERVLGFDFSCTRSFSEHVALAKKKGAVISTTDALIASIAGAHGMAIATRDEKPFKALGLRVINPWKLRSEI